MPYVINHKNISKPKMKPCYHKSIGRSWIDIYLPLFSYCTYVLLIFLPLLRSLYFRFQIQNFCLYLVIPVHALHQYFWVLWFMRILPVSNTQFIIHNSTCTITCQSHPYNYIFTFTLIIVPNDYKMQLYMINNFKYY